jgi:pyruvate dehydrogenase E2 component (dihydrolipoamide acetyltransferase)
VVASVGRIFASPLARRIAAQKGLDLATLKGSGPNGRIVRADVEAAQMVVPPAPAPTPAPAASIPSLTAAPATAPAAKAAPVPAARAAPVPAAKAARAAASGDEARRIADAVGIPYTDIKNSTMRKTVARRLSESKQDVPHFYLTMDCEIDALLGLRKQLNERHEIKVTVNDYVIKAAALSCEKVPAANASWTPDAILQYDRVDISVAVAIPDGLITPVIVDAGNKGLKTISTEMKDLAGRAREGKLKPAEFAGGTFSISNLGMFGIKDFGAIINPPQGCILAVGAGEQRAVVKGGELAVATVMSVTLSVDHRVVDGAVGAQWLKAFKGYIEDPVSMLL